ncbi:hypothetical protein FACS1894182_09100 [Bacteroidia bacterium]|nr:hypothetical protein FACS1894182_09100 [Bacteroidia bacterium]
MKKAIFVFLLSVFASGFGKVHSQERNDYIQFGGGLGLSFHGDDYGILFQGEYGKTWKWLDVSLSMAYETETPWNNYNSLSDILVNPSDDRLEDRIPNDFYSYDSSTALSLNARIDVVQFFIPHSRHAFKIGGGLGGEFKQSGYSVKNNDSRGVSYYFLVRNEIKPLATAMAGYEYDITQKLLLKTSVFCFSTSCILSKMAYFCK